MPRASRSFVPSVLVALAGLAGSLPAQVTERPPEPTPDADAKFREGRLAAAVRLRDAGHAHRGRLVLRGDATRAALDEIEACGVKIRGVSRDGRLDADLTGADLTALDETGLVATAGEHGFAERIDERLWDALAAPTGGRIKLFAHLHIGEDLDGALDRLRAMPGVSIAGVDREGLRHVVRIEAPESRVFGVADDNGIRWLEPAPVLTTRDANSRSIVQSGSVGQMPFDAFGLNGAGQIIGVIDTRPSASHCAFSDTVAIGPGHRKIVAYNASSGAHQHGTHVAALAVGDSGSADNVRGVAWGARMVFNTIPVFEEAQVRARFELHASQGAFVHNNSWGDDFVRTYTGLARAVDAFTYDNDEHVVLIATTNRSILYTPENAKNGVAVAATQNGNLSESFCLGGTGPTEDGRRKPDLLAPGCGVLSAFPFGGNCNTDFLSGTSMATPAVSGAAAIVRQYFMGGYHPGFVEGGSEPLVPLGPLVKAVLVNGGQDISGVSGYPTDREGWGRLLMTASVPLPGSGRSLSVAQASNNEPEALGDGDSHEMHLVVDDPSEPLAITMVFYDAPAVIGAASAAINDLDLVLYSPSGTVYRGNNFDTQSPVSLPGGVADPINSVERVLLANPEAGEWTVRLEGSNVLVGSQGFGLAATGAIASEGTPCSAADQAYPYGVLSQLDVARFVELFFSLHPRADLAEPAGVISAPDTAAFVDAFFAGCD